MTHKVKIGVLGCANIAKKYAIKAFQSIERAEVVAIASRDVEKAKKWGVDFSIRAVPSYDALVKDPTVDALYIPLPIGLHKEWILKAAQNGKHVLCEKALSDSLASVQEIVEVCKKSGAVLYENFMCGFHPQHERVLESIRTGDIGEPRIFSGYFGFPMREESDFRYSKALGGGSLNDAGSYTVFMARMLFGEPSAVAGALHVDDMWGVDVHGSAFVEFPDSRTALLGFSFDSVYQNNYSIWGSKGVITVNRAYSIPPEMEPDIELVQNDGNKEILQHLEAPAANHFELIFSDFCETILKKDQGKTTLMYDRILNQARAMEAIRMSSRENKKILLSYIP